MQELEFGNVTFLSHMSTGLKFVSDVHNTGYTRLPGFDTINLFDEVYQKQ